MSEPSRGFKTGSVLLAFVIGGGIIVLTGSILLPSTKRARVDFDKLRHAQDADPSPATAPTAPPATTEPATAPASQPATP